MAAALLLMLVTGLFIAGWVTMMSTRAIQVSWLENAVQRRLAVESSKLLSWQTVMEHGFEPKSKLDSATAMLLDGKGGALSTKDGWTNLNVYTELNSSAGSEHVFPYNHTGLRPGGTYFTREEFSRPAGLDNLDSFISYIYLKGQCPILNNDLFVVYRRPPTAKTELDVYTVTGQHTAYWQVYGRTVIRHAPSLFVLTTSKVTLPFMTKSLYVQSHDVGNYTPIIGTGMDNKVLLPSNLSAVPSSTGLTGEKVKDRFEGYLNVVKNDNNPDNSLWHIVDREKQAGRMGYQTIDTYVKSADNTGPYWMADYSTGGGDTPLYPPPGYPSGYPTAFKVLYINMDHAQQTHYRVSNCVNQIVFVGQQTSSAYEAAGAMSPIIVTLVEGAGQPTGAIVFAHENNRRLILGVKGNDGEKLDMSWQGKSILGGEQRWRMTLVNEYHTLWLFLHDNATINTRWIGGVMTNWTFKRALKSGTRSDRLVFQSDSAVPTLAPAGASYASLLPRDVWQDSFFFPIAPVIQ